MNNGIFPQNATRIRWEPRRSLAFGVLNNTYQGLGAAITTPARMIKIVNTTNADIDISLDGITDMDIAPASSAFIYDFASNKSTNGGNLCLATGDRFYVKTAGAPTSGAVYLVVIYGSAV